jgi:hypothetical protein
MVFLKDCIVSDFPTEVSDLPTQPMFAGTAQFSPFLTISLITTAYEREKEIPSCGTTLALTMGEH